MGQHIQDEHGRYVFEVVKFRHKDPANHTDAVPERVRVFHIEADDYTSARGKMKMEYSELLRDPEWHGDVEIYSGIWKKVTSQIAT